MSKKYFFTILYLGIFLLGTSFRLLKGSESNEEKKVVIETTLGKIKLKLYNETPLHRDNFIKLVDQHFYDGLLFHRVIQSFMIQGGDPDSKNSKSGIPLGNGEVGYTIPAEFHPNLFHKKGVLAAARQSDDINPNKESSGCQFYIVQGRSFTDSLLNLQEKRINDGIKKLLCDKTINQEENKALKEKLIYFQKTAQIDSMKVLFEKVLSGIEHLNLYKFSEEQRKTYTTIGGAPHLDGSYTVYGEVIEGMEVVDKIASVSVDGMARPIDDVKIIKAYIVKR